jgi:restriction system protein
VARRSSYASRLAQRQRELERQSRAQERAVAAATRAAERARVSLERAQAWEEKERKKAYVESRQTEVDAMNEDLAAENTTLETLLRQTLDVDDYLDFEALKEEPELPPFQPGALDTPEPAPDLATFMPVPLTGMGKLVPGAKAKYEHAVAAAREAYEGEKAAWAKREGEREASLARARAEHDAAVEKIKARAEGQNREADEFHARFDASDPAAIVEYFSLILNISSYPEDFPKQHKMAFVPESKQLVVECELPSLDAIPTDKLYRYVKARDVIEETARPATQVKALYLSVVAQVTIRTLHELFEADRNAKLETIVFNGYVNTIDPATGKPVTPHLVTVRASRDVFLQLDLRNVEPLACLKGLNASVSKSPSELVPVRPILEFNMVDPRFIQESDVLGALDERPNLMELSPTEFESLISNLFEKMGLETRQTQASRDGGVDCVAYDPRPIFGGKVVIQAKRYKHTVGVSAVRDLYGTMQNEGASKGILVSTSGYGKSSFQFAEGKPLELLSGTHLLYLLAEHAGIEARIEPPEDWVDPAADVATDEAPIETLPVVDGGAATNGEVEASPVTAVLGEPT